MEQVRTSAFSVVNNLNSGVCYNCRTDWVASYTDACPTCVSVYYKLRRWPKCKKEGCYTHRVFSSSLGFSHYCALHEEID